MGVTFKYNFHFWCERKSWHEEKKKQKRHHPKRGQFMISNHKVGFTLPSDLVTEKDILNKDVLIHIFASLDLSTLGSILLASKEFYSILQDDSVWKKLALVRYPSLKKVNVDFSANKMEDPWRSFYIKRINRYLSYHQSNMLNRERLPARLLNEMHSDFQQSGSLKNLTDFLSNVRQLETYTQVAGYFPINKKYKKNDELAFFADTIIYTKMHMEIDNMIGYKVPSIHFFIFTF